jgi:acyl-CoA dehydrogenase
MRSYSGKAALARAIDYAKSRMVFGRPIGQNQGLQFPLADAYSKLECADLMVFKAAWIFDHGQPCGKEANIAKLRAAEAGFEACDWALQTRGGSATPRSSTSNGSGAKFRFIKSPPCRSR